MDVDLYMHNKAVLAKQLCDGIQSNLEDYLAKAAEGYPQDVRAMARCLLGRRLSGCRGTCFALPDTEDL